LFIAVPWNISIQLVHEVYLLNSSGHSPQSTMKNEKEAKEHDGSDIPESSQRAKRNGNV
jgi:hypothetical protein